MHIAFDVMGGDNESKVAVTAAVKIVKEFDDTFITLVGKEKEIKSHLLSLNLDENTQKKLKIHHAPNVIKMGDSILDALRQPDSSMAVTVELMKKKQVDGILTSGSTSAYLVICHTVLGEIPGINKPAFMPVMPTLIRNKVVLLLDVGANVENTSDELLAFAIMASTYSNLILNVKQPKVALLNIGIEANKGTKKTKETYQKFNKLTQKEKNQYNFNFIGNIEPRSVLSGETDIVVCDGYSGNVVLKSVEGMATIIFSLIKTEFTKNWWRKFLAFLSLNIFKDIKKSFNYKNVGGAQLIGINGICFKAHGSSDVQSYYSTLKLLRIAIKQDVTNKIKEKINLSPSENND